MALLESLTDDERQRLLGTSAPGAGATSLPSASPPQEGGPAPTASGFTSLADYFGANKEAAGQLADKVSGGLKQNALDALNQDDLTKAQGTLADINAAASGPGLSAVLEKQEGGGYTGGLGRLDAYLANRAGGEKFTGLRDYFGKPLGGVEAAPTLAAKPSDVPAVPDIQGIGLPNNGSIKNSLEDQAAARAAAAQKFADERNKWQTDADAYNKSLEEYNAWVDRRNKNVEGVEGVTKRDKSKPIDTGLGPYPYRRGY